MAEVNSYEELRRKQVEGNKRKLEELRLHHLSAAVREAGAKPKPVRQIDPLASNSSFSSGSSFVFPVTTLIWLVSQKRKAPPRRDIADVGPPRRSGRIATLPEQPDYRDNVKLGTVKSQKKKEVKPDHAYAISKAEELQDELGSDYPTFVKPMTQSLTMLYIPVQFSSISRTVTQNSLWWMMMTRSSTCSIVHTVAALIWGGEISLRTMSWLMVIAWCFS